MLILAQTVCLLLSPAIGSYLKCRADRLGDAGAVSVRSACDHCGETLAVRDLIPVLSWLWLRGRSRCCHRALAPSLLMVELLAIALTAWALLVTEGTVSLISIALAWTLLGLAVIDLQHFRLPDIATLPLIPIGLLLSVLGVTGPLWSHALGALAGFGFLYAIHAVYLRVRGIEGLGLGDAKLLAAAGAWLGIGALPGVMLIACFAALSQAVISAARHGMRRDLAIPFGPALCLGFWITWLYGPIVLVALQRAGA